MNWAHDMKVGEVEVCDTIVQGGHEVASGGGIVAILILIAVKWAMKLAFKSWGWCQVHCLYLTCPVYVVVAVVCIFVSRKVYVSRKVEINKRVNVFDIPNQIHFLCILNVNLKLFTSQLISKWVWSDSHMTSLMVVTLHTYTCSNTVSVL